MAAVRARRSLAEMDGWLDLSAVAHLRAGAEVAAALERYPDAVPRSVALADELAFDLRKASPRLPKHRIPAGRTADEWLRELADRGFAERYAGTPHADEARARIDHELRVIAEKDFAGYFVIVHDIVDFARSRGILCQGRGSAASSAVCYALGITAVDAVFYRLPFERFISAHRDEEPDIDVDFDSDRREEVIQWVYDTYGRHNAAQVANVISYRPRMAVRDAAKALGHSQGQQDAWSKQVDGWQPVVTGDTGDDTAHDIPSAVVDLAGKLLGAPRHLGIHSGGMVLTERPIGEVCPIERARMDRRTVLQWDKDACESMGLVKFDLLGLGMLGALDHMIRLVDEHLGERWTLATLPKEEPAVYDMLCRADSVGVFQVESRAQIGTLPRLRPREFYDLAIEIALIRPGPIQGGAVHPYVRRATGPGAGHLRPPRPRAGARAHPRRPAVPGAADGDGGGARRLQPRRRRPAAPRDGVQARGRADREHPRHALRRHGATRAGGCGRRRDLREDPVVRQLRLRGVARAELRPAGVRRRRGSSCTTPRPSWRDCSATSRWGSTRRSRWWATRDGTASRCGVPTCCGPVHRPGSSRCDGPARTGRAHRARRLRRAAVRAHRVQPRHDRIPR